MQMFDQPGAFERRLVHLRAKGKIRPDSSRKGTAMAQQPAGSCGKIKKHAKAGWYIIRTGL
jgi:hypothetical protein